MFCPRCAAHNIDDARYCRVCGADISLLPQVLSGEITANLMASEETAVEEREGRRKGKKKDKDKEKPTPTLEKAFENIGVGLAFLVISIMIAFYMPGGRFWWFWLLIPTGACVGEGIGQFIRIKREKALGGARAPLLPQTPPAEQSRHLPPLNTSEIVMPPPSITESTTRHLSPQPLKKNPDESTERAPSVLDSNSQ
jgi:hypothetical protein